MHLTLASSLVCGLLIASTLPLRADDSIDVDFLFSYYDQDGDHSAVTGGIGSESLQVASPIIVVAWRLDDDWTLSSELGIDQISSASIGAIQDGVSGASIPASDQRTFGRLGLSRKFGAHTLGISLRGAGEYDYESRGYGLDYKVDLFDANSTLGIALRRFDDELDLVDIDGIVQGVADRETTDTALTWSQVLSARSVASIELFSSQQSGFLSTPFHEVVLVDGTRVPERLPDERDRKALGLRWRYAFSRWLVQRVGYRFYDDDWGIQSHTLELETHFRLDGSNENWIYPILRYHLQDGSDFFGEFGTFSGDETYLTSDWDLSETKTWKIGIGWSTLAPPGSSVWLGIERFEVRATFLRRDDGLQGVNMSFGLGWTF